MKGHLTKNLELFQFEMVSISGTLSKLSSVQIRLCFPIPVLLLSHFLSPYSLSSLQALISFFSTYVLFQNFSILSLGSVSFTITSFFSISLKKFLVSVWKILFCLSNLLRVANHLLLCVFI